jgi:toxin ParE1/3/4
VVAYRVTEAAKQDFKAVLKDSLDRFGTHQRDSYKRLIAQAVTLVAADPLGGGSWDRGALFPGLRAFHLDHAAGRRAAAAHTLYYLVADGPDGSPQVVILRLLHESMEPRLHVARSGM